jgi:hypothetical protein
MKHLKMNSVVKRTLWLMLTALMFPILTYFIYNETLLAVFLGCTAFIFSLVIESVWPGKDTK